MVLKEFNKDLAVFLAQCCFQTYQQYENNGQFEIPEGYELVQAFKAVVEGVREWFGFIIQSSERAVIAFRGSKSFLDWVADAEFSQTPYPYVLSPAQTHSGFTDIYTSCRNQLLAALESLPPFLELCITGHSLGGALAVLCALDMATHCKFRHPVMYNFGAPRVGNPKFALAYDREVKVSKRIVNIFDIVPHLPPVTVRSLFSKNVWYYRHVGDFAPIAVQTGNIAENHALQTYLDGLLRPNFGDHAATFFPSCKRTGTVQ